MSKSHETRKARELLERRRHQAKDAFIQAAAVLSDPFQDPAEALLLGGIGMLRMAQSDPEEKLLDRAEGFLRDVRTRRTA